MFTVKCSIKRNLYRALSPADLFGGRTSVGAILNWPSAFGSIFAGAQAAQVLLFCASVTTVHLLFFVIGRVLTRLDLYQQPQPTTNNKNAAEQQKPWVRRFFLFYGLIG